VEVVLSLYVSSKPGNLNANLPYIKGRYELVKGVHFGEIPKRVKSGGRRCSRSIDEFSMFTSKPGFQCLPSDKFLIKF